MSPNGGSILPGGRESADNPQGSDKFRHGWNNSGSVELATGFSEGEVEYGSVGEEGREQTRRRVIAG